MTWCSHCKTLTPTPCDETAFKTCERYLNPDALQAPKPKLPTLDNFMAKMLATIGPTIRAIAPGCHCSVVIWTHDPDDPEWKVHVATSAQQEEMMAAFTAMLKQWREPGKMSKLQ